MTIPQSTHVTANNPENPSPVLPDKKIQVLVIEDSPEDTLLTIRQLKSGGYLVSHQRVETEKEMTEALESESWDLILCDYSMPQFNVQRALEIYHDFGLDIPFIVISGVIGEEKAVELIHAGVHDCVMKTNLKRVISVVDRALQVVRNKRELREVSIALAVSEAKYKNYLENAPDVVFVADTEGNFTEVNEAACKITGYSRDELLKMSVREMMSEEAREHGLNLLHNLHKSGSFSADFEVTRKNGSRRWFAIDAVLISGILVLGFAKDITDRKIAILEVIKTREELQQLNKYLMDAREDERAKVAMEIHDELGQALTAIKIDLNRVTEDLGTGHESCQKISRIIEMTNETIKKVQRISAELRPGLLDDLGLASAIEWYCDEYQQRTGIICHLELQEVQNWDRRINLALFRIFQEALTNIIRHAGATTTWVSLSYTGQGITMIISDDGAGIPQEKIKCLKSLGIIGMRERARQLNGRVEFSQNVPSGTKILTYIPMLPSQPDPYENTNCR